MKVYTWYRNSDKSIVERCAFLFNKADYNNTLHGKSDYPIRSRFEEDGETETVPGYYGFPVGPGSEAGNNHGAFLFKNIRDSIDNGTNPALSAEELLELQNFCALEEDINSSWNWDISDPNYNV